MQADPRESGNARVRGPGSMPKSDCMYGVPRPDLPLFLSKEQPGMQCKCGQGWAERAMWQMPAAAGVWGGASRPRDQSGAPDYTPGALCKRLHATFNLLTLQERQPPARQGC